LRALRASGVNASGAFREAVDTEWGVSAPSLGPHADWTTLVAGNEVVIHAAGRAHIREETKTDVLREFRYVNTEGTRRLAEDSAAVGVKRFLFISSIGVNGDSNNRPFTESDEPSPQEAYAISKYEAEIALWKVGTRTGMEIVIVRPPLVYGPRAPGNFGRLMAAVARGIPLPLGGVTNNRRTLVGLDNLIDLLGVCTTHPAAANQLFLAGDDEAVSTAKLIRRLAEAMQVSVRLVPVPLPLLEFAGSIVGRRAMINRLCGSLEVDSSKARRLLAWSPPLGLEEGLAKAVQGVRGRRRDSTKASAQ